MKLSYEELEKKLVDTEARLIYTETKLANTEEKLANTEEKLANTEEKLANTDEKLAETQRLLRLALDRIVALEERINKNSKNSSKPPSTDQKTNSLVGSSPRKTRNKGINRAAFPPEQVDHFVTCHLKQCPCCGSHKLSDLNRPLLLQQVDLPEVKAIITEFSCTKYKCSSCGKAFFANLPAGTPNSSFGPRLMALIANLTGAFHLSKRDVMQLVNDLYGIEISEGSIINVEERVANALKEVDERIQRFVMTSGFTKHFDETSWRNSGKNHFVWIGSTDIATCFRIYSSRSLKAFERFVGRLGDAPVVTDRYAVYSNVSSPHQYCLAHLIREFRRYSERDGPDADLGSALEEELRKVCKNHRAFREGQISKRSRNARFRYQKAQLELALIDGLANGSDELSGLCNRLLDNFHKLWTFSNFTKVDPTNNLAERDLRKLVLWRKKSYGTRSDRGKRFVERISAVCTTARKARRNIFAFVTDAIEKFYLGDPAPTIRPTMGF